MIYDAANTLSVTLYFNAIRVVATALDLSDLVSYD